MKILIVDDSGVHRKIIRRDLEAEGAGIHKASSGKEALELIPKIKPDAITLDVEMADMNGYDVCARLRSCDHASLKGHPELADIPVVFITSNDTLEGREKGFSSGGTDFVTKPFLKGEVLQLVRKLLTKEGPLVGLSALVVDDSNVARRIIASSLASEGINVVEARDGREALEFLNSKVNVDLVITDFEMPEMNGDELCRNIREKLGMKDIPVIFLTAMAERDLILQLFKCGATDYLVKPFAKEELLARLKVHLNEKRLRDDLAGKVNQLKKMNKLKDDFLAIASHDLRSPLSGILGFTELVLEADYLKEEEREFMTHIQDSGRFLLTLINDILDLSKLQSDKEDLKLQPTALDAVIPSCVKTLQHMANPKEIRLSFENQFSSGAPMVLGDINALNRIVNNLLSNAIKFTPRNGSVRLVFGPKDERSVQFSVIDSGIGIPSDKIPLLFDKFSKTSQAGTEGEKSTGLGMSITKELIDRHNGAIEVKSTVGEGTTIIVSLPISAL